MSQLRTPRLAPSMLAAIAACSSVLVVDVVHAADPAAAPSPEEPLLPASPASAPSPAPSPAPSAAISPAPRAAASAAPLSAVEVASPDVSYPPDSARWGVLFAGLGTFAGSYGGMAAMGAAWSDVPSSDSLFVPVAGPWIALAGSGCAPDEETTPGQGDCDGMMGLRGTLYVLGGLLQLGGLGIVAESAFMTTQPAQAKPSATAFLPTTIVPSVVVTPSVMGVGVSGTF